MVSILILGGTGYIGKALIDLLCEDDRLRIFATYRSKKIMNNKVTWVYCDRDNSDHLNNLANIQNFDIIVDTACYNAFQAKLAIQIFSDKVNYYIVLSSQAIYPKGDSWKEIQAIKYSTAQLQEEEASYPHHAYSIGKRLVESFFLEAKTVNSCIIRFPIVVNDKNGFFYDTIKKYILSKQIYTYSDESEFSLISLDEAIHFIKFIIFNPFKGVINACSNGVFSLAYFKQELIHLGINCRLYKKRLRQLSHPFDVHTLWEQDDDMSIMCVTDNWTIDNNLAKQFGFKFDNIICWFPKYLKLIYNKILLS